ncbi:MAG TPA: L,D-transpeptidase [Acidimicrobiales bacterium]|nr:L,D-transpeptidase [Acidimicrobiales bacterium]
MKRRLSGRIIVSLLLATTLLVAGCGGDDNVSEPTTTPTTVASGIDVTNIRPGYSVVANAKVPTVNVYANRGDTGTPRHRLSNPTEIGGPLVFLVERGDAEWLQVNLPVRPNGSTGWIRASDVTLTEHNYRIVVELAAHRITVTQGNQVILAEPVALGESDTPTPGGKFYTKELLQPPNPNTVYGPYAYGLSGFSNALTSFAGGEAIIGIHGNNDPSTLGKDVSAGCIRMSNSGITKLATTLPLGVPVEIRP